MARVGNVPTVSAYKGNIGQQLIKVGDRLEDISQDFEKKQEKELAEAKKLYTQGLNINLYNGINELRNDPNLSSNPKGLSSAMDKVLESTLKDVDDDEVKIAVMADYQLKKGTYINQAQTEFNRIQRERARSDAFDTIYNNMDAMETSFVNALTGSYTDDDVINFQRSADIIKERANALDVDGTYLFSDAQRHKYMEDIDKIYVNGFKNAYNRMNREQKKNMGAMLDKDAFTIAVKKDGEEYGINLSDIVGKKPYKEIKEIVRAVKTLNEEMAYDFLNSDASNAEKVAYINEQEYEGNISEKFATRARRILKTESEGKQKTLSDAEAINNVLQQASDLVNTSDSDEEYLIGLKNLKEYMFEMQEENKLNSKDAITLWNQVSSLTRSKTAEATRSVAWAFEDVNNLISDSLPPESRAEAIRELFYATGGKELDKVDLRKKAVDVIQSIQNKNRAKAIQQVNNIIAEEKINKTADDFFKGFGL